MSDSIQHKPANTGVFFDDQSRPVLVVEPPEPPELALLHALEDAGALVPGREAAAMAVIDAHLPAIAEQRAAECLHVVYSRLAGQGKQGALLRAALLSAVGMADAESMAGQAGRFGIARQNWHRAIARLRERLQIG